MTPIERAVRLAGFFDGARQGRRDAAREMAEVTW